MANMQIENLTKIYRKKVVLDHISFTVKDGEFLSILGPSGCGKTTLLRILIGIENCDTGRIMKDGIDITNEDTKKRQMGMVFQNYALFPNMTVLQNVMYALYIKIKNKEKAKKQSMEMLKIVCMDEHVDQYPHELSGGQQQRVAIARALVLKPEVILFDEPMSALDADNRLVLRRELKKIQKELHTTMIYITHDQEEAFSLSDRVMVMHNGKIEQIDTPNIVYNKPASAYVENFVAKHLKEKVSSIEKCTGIDL